jgi:hypothetical protein
MYDDSDLAISELYFLISQLLRFSDLWIRESLNELSRLMGRIESSHFNTYLVNHLSSFLNGGPEAQQAQEAFHRISEALLSDHKTLADQLLERVKGLENDVKRLREGVRNILDLIAEFRTLLGADHKSANDYSSSQRLPSARPPSPNSSTTTSLFSLWSPSFTFP